MHSEQFLSLLKNKKTLRKKRQKLYARRGPSTGMQSMESVKTSRS